MVNSGNNEKNENLIRKSWVNISTLSIIPD